MIQKLSLLVLLVQDQNIAGIDLMFSVCSNDEIIFSQDDFSGNMFVFANEVFVFIDHRNYVMMKRTAIPNARHALKRMAMFHSIG